MLTHSFVLDALGSTGADTFEHFEQLIDEHREIYPPTDSNGNLVSPREAGAKVSRLLLLVPTVKTFFTRLPLRSAFLAYDAKYAVTKRRHVCISFNEIRHILNLSQIMAMCKLRFCLF